MKIGIGKAADDFTSAAFSVRINLIWKNQRRKNLSVLVY